MLFEPYGFSLGEHSKAADLQKAQVHAAPRLIWASVSSVVRRASTRRSLRPSIPLLVSFSAPRKFEQVLSFLQGLVEMVEKNEFGFHMQESLRALYGTDPTLRGAGLDNYRFQLSKMKPRDPDFEEAKNLMAARLAEEIADVGREYELFLHEHVENTRAARVAATAPSHAQWAAIIRQQNALHRQLEHKIRLLEEMQERRKKEEERLAQTSRSPKSAAFPNPSGGSGGGVEEPRTPNEGIRPTTVSAALRQSAHPKAADLEKQGCATRLATPSPGPPHPAPDGAGPRLMKTPAAGHPFRQGGEGWKRLATDLQKTQACAPGSWRRFPSDGQCGGGQACNTKKILNRGNELKVLLKTQGLTETTPSKRTPFCAEKVAIEAKKMAFRCNHQSSIINRQSTIGHRQCYRAWVNTSRSSSMVRVRGLPLVLLAFEAFSTRVGTSRS